MGLAFLITTEHLHLIGERKVLKADEYGALVDAAALIAAARREAERVRDEAVRQARQRRREGYQQGWREAQAEHARHHFTQAWRAEHAVHAQREAMARLVVETLAQCLGEVDAAARFAAVLRRLDSLWAQEPVVTLRVPPALLDEARAAVQEALGDTRHGRQVTVLADDSLSGDDARAQTASGTVELGLQAQVEALRRALHLAAEAP